MQVAYVPLQLQLEDERRINKMSDYLKRKDLERSQKVIGVLACAKDVLQPKHVEGGVQAAYSGNLRAVVTDMPVKTN